MTGLVLKLRPHEKLLINGAVLQNGDKAARLRIRTAGASVLRLRDALHPDETTTPLRRIYYIAQLAVAGAADAEAAKVEILEALGAVRAQGSDEGTLNAVAEAENAVRQGRLFAAMRALRRTFSAPASASGSQHV